MDMIMLLRLVNLIFLIIIGVLLFINRKAENQGKMRLAFLILVVLFIVQLLF